MGIESGIHELCNSLIAALQLSVQYGQLSTGREADELFPVPVALPPELSERFDEHFAVQANTNALTLGPCNTFLVAGSKDSSSQQMKESLVLPNLSLVGQDLFGCGSNNKGQLGQPFPVKNVERFQKLWTFPMSVSSYSHIPFFIYFKKGVMMLIL